MGARQGGCLLRARDSSVGREKAREALATTGHTHRGKASLGRPPAADAAAVVAWRAANGRQHRQDGRALRPVSGDGQAVLQPGCGLILAGWRW